VRSSTSDRISELRSVTHHIGSQCYLPPDTAERTCLALTSVRLTSTRSTYPEGMKGWVDLGGWDGLPVHRHSQRRL